jgi:hypothetical protein
MADKGWIFKYGRVPITFVCQDYLADVTPLALSCPYSGSRFSHVASPCSTWRPPSLQALRDGRGVCDYGRDHAPELFRPPEKHFYPSARNAKTISDFTVVNFVPNIIRYATPVTLSHGVLTLVPLQPFAAQGVDSWDFVLRGMFIQKTKPIKKVVG